MASKLKKKTAKPAPKAAKKPVAKASKPKAAAKKPAAKAKPAKPVKPVKKAAPKAAKTPTPKAVKQAPAPAGKAKPVPAAGKTSGKRKAAPVSNGKLNKGPVPIPPPKPIRGINLDDLPPIPAGKQPPLPAAFLKKQKQRLLDLRSHLMETMEGVANDSIRNRPEGSEASVGGMHMGDAGSDAYDRDFALSLLSKEQDALYEIQEALKRIDLRSYGYCEMTGRRINEERLDALPFARYTREAQEQIERNQFGNGPRRVPAKSIFNLDEDGESEDEDGDDEEATPAAPANESSLDFMKE